MRCATPDRTFTQEDPIGLAGGLNLYGFAGGDPLNFSDPFGLTPCYDKNGNKIPCPSAAATLAAAAVLIAADGPLPIGDVLAGIAVTGFLVNSLFAQDGVPIEEDDSGLDLRDLSKGEVKGLEDVIREDGYPSIEHLKSPGGKGASKLQVRVDKKTGDIYVGPRRGPGVHEPTGYNLRDLP